MKGLGLYLSLAGIAAGLALAPAVTWSQTPGPGEDIKIGNTSPYSGPASSYGTIGKTQAAYFAMLNDKGGINGRKINFITYDDAYSPPKTVEQVRRLIENDQVLLLYGTSGIPSFS